MSDSKYLSNYTGAEIDNAVRAIEGLAWTSHIISISSGSTQILWNDVKDYPLIVLTGYKVGVDRDQQTTSVILSTSAIDSRTPQSGNRYTLNVPFAVRDYNYVAWPNVLVVWIDGGYLKWQTADDYSSSKDFAVTKVEGFAISRGQSEEE